MWIEYDLRFEKEVFEKGMFNTDQIKWIQVEQHGGGYGKAIEMYYDGYNTKCIFIINDDEILEKVWHALQNAIAGVPSCIAGIGFIRPVQRPFDESKTLIPSAYEKPLC